MRAAGLASTIDAVISCSTSICQVCPVPHAPKPVKKTISAVKKCDRTPISPDERRQISRNGVLRVIPGNRPTDLLGRYGGEEIVALISRALLEDVCQIAERLLHALRETPIISNGQALSITMSLGVAPLTKNTSSLEQLLSNADQAKNLGCNRWV